MMYSTAQQRVFSWRQSQGNFMSVNLKVGEVGNINVDMRDFHSVELFQRLH